MPTVKRIDHLAILVDDMDETLSFWQDALGLKLSRREDVPQENSRVGFLPVGESEIELVEPAGPDSGLRRQFEKQGPGMHHLCLEVDDIEGMLELLKQKGVRLINQTPMLGPGGKRYAFIHPKSANGVLVELYELPPAA
jgi:methylmalonyl-CoA/ethylmalonyl-CoA epimerase